VIVRALAALCSRRNRDCLPTVVQDRSTEDDMPAGASAKREREYDELKYRFQKERRYPGREEEVAARIVNKQRSQYGETKEEKAKDRSGQSPDRNLPIRDYQHLTVAQVAGRLRGLSNAQVRQLERYERKHKNRATLLKKLEQARAGG
jgi:hypothetical protein